jgi:hypothetical protein
MNYATITTKLAILVMKINIELPSANGG